MYYFIDKMLLSYWLINFITLLVLTLTSLLAIITVSVATILDLSTNLLTLVILS